MFRATLDRFHLTEQWYNFLDRQHRILAIEWCEENGIEYETSQRYEDEEDLDEEDEIEQVKAKEIPLPKGVRIIQISRKNIANIVYMNADFEVETAISNIEDSQEELDELLQTENVQLYSAVQNGKTVGFMVVQIDDTDLVLKKIFVKKEFRRQKIACAMFDYAKQLIVDNQLDDLKVKLHPANVTMLKFLNYNNFNTLEELTIGKQTEKESEHVLSLDHVPFHY